MRSEVIKALVCFSFVFGCGALGYIDARRSEEVKELEAWRELGVAIKKAPPKGSVISGSSGLVPGRITWTYQPITIQCMVCGLTDSEQAMKSHHCDLAPVCSSCNGSGRAK